MCITKNRNVQKLITQVIVLQSKLSSLYAENKELQAELDKYRWIPVAERLPKKYGDYAVTDGAEWWLEGWGFVDHSGATKGWECNNNEITHWKPIILPESEGKDEL